MAFLSFKNVRISGISAGVPKVVVSNLDLTDLSADYTPEAFVEMTGVKERRIDNRFTTSDLCYAAAERLIADLGWQKDEIDAVVFVTQNQDYILPATACILQQRLGLPKECYALDVSLGCSGWVYGLSTVAGLISNDGIKKALLLAGDGKRHYCNHNDPLFGHAGTATALEFAEGAPGLMCHYGTDGSGYDAIIIPDGGTRNVVTEKSFEMHDVDGKQKCRLETHMKGMDVFSFGISTAPKSVKKLAEHFGFDYQTQDYYLFHQANMKMNNMIVKKLKLDPAKVPSCMLHFGNTSSASIPLTIVTQLKGNADVKSTKYLCCGFGVGLSWGTVAFEDKIVISDLVEVGDADAPADGAWV